MEDILKYNFVRLPSVIFIQIVLKPTPDGTIDDRLALMWMI